MPKSADAFRTISEVADWLETPAHVLRFWESKFSQVKPVKRAGGRRYYRPSDMLLLGGIKKLLHDDGMTIKGVQKILREQGVKHVAEMSQSLEEGLQTDEGSSGITLDAEPAQPESATVLNFKSTSPAPTAFDPAPDDIPEDLPEDSPETMAQGPQSPDSPSGQAPDTLAAEGTDDLPESAAPSVDDTALSQAPDTLAGGAPDGVEDTVRNALAESDTAPQAPETVAQDDAIESDQAETPSDAPMPSFLRNRGDDDATPRPTPPADPDTAPSDPEDREKAQAPTPAQIEVSEDPTDDIAADPGFLSQLSAHKSPIDPATAKSLAPLIDRLRALQEGAAKQG